MIQFITLHSGLIKMTFPIKHIFWLLGIMVLHSSIHAAIDITLANKLFGKHQYHDALVAYQAALRSCQSTDCDQSPEILNKIAMCYLFTNRTDSAITVYEEAITTSIRFENLEQHEDALSALGEIFSFRGDAARALTYFKEMTDISKSRGNKELLMGGYAQIGSLYRTMGELDSAKLYLDLAVFLSESVMSKKAIPMVYKFMGDFYADITNYEDAQIWYLRCLDVQHDSGDSTGMTSTLITIADMFNQQGQYELSEDYLKDVLAIADSKGLKIRKALALNSLSTIYQSRGDLSKARSNLMEALKIFSEVKNLTRVAHVYQKLGKISSEEQLYTEALKYYSNSIRLFDSLQTFEGSLASKIGEAQVYQLMGSHNRTINRIKKILDEVQTRQTSTLEMEAYRLLSYSFAKNQDFEEAYFYENKYNDIRNKIFNKERAEVLNNTDKKYNIARKEIEIVELQSIQFQQEARIERQRLMNMGLLITGIILAILALIFYQNYMKGRVIGKQRKELHAQKITSLEKENRLAQVEAMLAGQENERERIAKDLHDGLGGVLSTIKIQFDAFLEEDMVPSMSQPFQKANQMLDEACDEVRRIAHNMVPEIITQLGLIPALEDLAFNLRNKDIKVHVETLNLNRQLSPELKKTIYRIVQELFSNIAKHAEASEVILQLSEQEDHLSLIVEDDGAGFDAFTPSIGMGMKNISSRVDFFQGTFDIESKKGEGTTVTVRLPLQNVLSRKPA